MVAVLPKRNVAIHRHLLGCSLSASHGRVTTTTESRPVQLRVHIPNPPDTKSNPNHNANPNPTAIIYKQRAVVSG